MPRMGTNCPNDIFCFLVDLQTISAKYALETWFCPNDYIRICLLDMQRSWTKKLFETWRERNDLNGVYFFHISYLITVLAYLCSQLATVVQIKYFKWDWLFYRLFVLNTGYKRDYL
jgi:hypothetical protein